MAGTNPPGSHNADAGRDAARFDLDDASPLPARFDIWGRPPGQEEPAPSSGGPSGEADPSDPSDPAPASSALPAEPPRPNFPVQAYPVQAYPVQAYPVQAYPVQAYPAQAIPAQAIPAQAISAQALPAQGQLAPAYPAQALPAQGQLAPAYPAQAQPAQGYPAQGHPAQVFPAQVFPAQPALPDQKASGSPALSPPSQLAPGQMSAGQGETTQPPWLPQNPGQASVPSWQPDSGRFVDPFRTPADTGPAPKRRGPKILRRVLAFILVAAIAVAVKGGAKMLDAIGTSKSTFPTATAPSGVSATSAASVVPTGPFEGTPAAQYPEAETGITLPAGTAVPGFTAVQVNARLQQVKQALVASRLDPAMLISRDTTPLLKLLSPEATKQLMPYFNGQNFFGFATQVAPGYSLTTDKVRVSGRVTFRGKTANGVRFLEVTSNFVWVYPFAGALQKSGDHLVIVHDEVTWEIPVDADVDKNYRGLHINGWNGYASNMDCDLLKKSLLALGKPRPGPAGAGEDNNADFDPSRSLDIASTC
jgi:hypothetical protein